MKDFSIGEILSKSFDDFKKNWKVLLGSFAIVLVISVLGNRISVWTNGQLSVALLSFLLSLVILVVQLALSVGLIRIALAVVDGKAVSINMLWDSLSNLKLLGIYFLTSLIVALAVGIGFILLIIPGIIIAVKLGFAVYFVADKMQGPIDAIKSSWDRTKGMFLKLFVFFIVMGLINFGAALLLVIPLLVTVPVTMVAMARVYRRLAS